MLLLNILQEHGKEAAQHGAEAAGQASHAAEAAGHGEHVPIIVEKLNEWLGPAVFDLQSKIMPPIYKVFSFMFGDHWPGEGKSYQQYVAEGNLPIPTHVVMFLFVVLIAVVVLTIIRGKLSAESPTHRQQTFEVGVEMIRGLLGDLVGPGGMKHFPIVATFAILILLSNLTGFLPDMIAPTANFNTTLALALTSFLYYNYIGIKENGLLGHLKHFCGPIWWMAWLMFPIELISNLARILSLSMRLFGNIFGEEQVSGAISAMVQWVVPALIMPLGFLTAVLQTFIFILLSMIYLGEVSQHSEEHAEHKHAVPAAAH
ncbi:MAG: F0F1 ATP synthase subunit A [Acidobacteria bacterium]|nr:F0F1 ATP synthase subunit A [Acidobacteriota bacterium]